MSEIASTDITRLLKAWGAGDVSARDRIIPQVHQELRRIARRYMRKERRGITLQSGALVNEAYLRLVDISHMDWQDRAHFFGVAAQIMRRILVDAARVRSSGKRSGQLKRVEHSEAPDLDHAAVIASERDWEIIAIDDALNALGKIDQRKAQVVELRFFTGLSVDETAQVLKISAQSVMRDWKLARAWLTRHLKATA